MTAIESDILKALEDLQSTVAKMATANPKPDLRPIFSRLDELTAAFPKGSDPQLAHFLRNKSYEKAHQWLAAKKQMG